MSGFLYTLLATCLAGFGARDQVLVAQLALIQGRRPALLAVALIAAAASCVPAVWLATRLLGDLTPAARGLFGSLALLLAGGEMLLLGPPRAPAEPTRSLFAAGIVLLGFQVTDAARLLVLALAVETAAPVPAGLGGALGSVAGLLAGWSAPPAVIGPRARRIRRMIGAGLLLAGLATGLPNVIGIGV